MNCSTTSALVPEESVGPGASACGHKGRNEMLGYTLGAVWLVGMLITTFLLQYGGDDFDSGSLFIIVAWPIVLTSVVVMLPFELAHEYGKHLHKKREEAKKEKEKFRAFFH
jgi:hypothetical protein